MKHLINLIIILSLFTQVGFAQKTKRVTNLVTNEKFYVLKDDKKIRHGEYKMFNFADNLSIKGYYNYGVKDSVWEFFNLEKQLISKYDYTNDELILYSSFVWRNKKCRLIVNENKIDTTLSRSPVFLGGDEMIVGKIRYPITAMQSGKSGRVIVSFTVDKFGKASNYHIDTPPVGYGIDEEVIRVLKIFSDFWMPGRLNGEPVDVEVEYPFSFNFLGVFRR